MNGPDGVICSHLAAVKIKFLKHKVKKIIYYAKVIVENSSYIT